MDWEGPQIASKSYFCASLLLNYFFDTVDENCSSCNDFSIHIAAILSDLVQVD